MTQCHVTSVGYTGLAFWTVWFPSLARLAFLGVGLVGPNLGPVIFLEHTCVIVYVILHLVDSSPTCWM